MRTAEVLDAVDVAVKTRQRLLISVVNAAKLVNMSRDEALRRAVIGADLVVADGMAVVWACRLLARRLPERVAGIDLMTRILEQADERRYRVYCLGATPEVLDIVTRRIREMYPNIDIVGGRDGYFSDDQEEQVARQIAAARPDVLFVGMTSPKKEEFLANWASNLNVPVCHGVGGAFDVMAGKVRRAPRPMQRLGLEWLYRVLQEPRRLWKRYLLTNTVFVGMVIRESWCGIRRFVSGPLKRRPTG